MANSKRILVAEDNEDLALLVAEHLEESGHVVRVAYDGFKALELAETFAPELAILDIGLPGIGGNQVALKLTERVGDKRIRLFAVTGSESDEDRALAFEAGFEKYFVKPIMPETIEEAVDGLEEL